MSNQVIAFGRKTLPQDGIASFTNEAMSTDSGTAATLTLGTRTVGSDHIEVSGNGVRPKASANPTDAQYVWTGCTVDNSGSETSNTFTLTINTAANAYDVDGWDELELASEEAGLNYGDTIYLRGGEYNILAADKRSRRTTAFPGGTYTRPSVKTDPRQGMDLTTGNPVVITTRVALSAEIGGLTLDNFDGFTARFLFRNLLFTHSTGATAAHNSYIFTGTNGAGADVFFDSCTFTGEVGFTPSLDAELHSGIKLAAGDWIAVQDCTFSWLAIQLNFGAGDNHYVVGNTVTQQFEDFYKAQGGSNHYTTWNTVYLLDALVLSSPNEVHPDIVQWVGPAVSVDTVEFVGNRVFQGQVSASGNATGQGFFMDNGTAGARTTGLLIAGNFLSLNMTRGLTWQETDNAIVRNNTVINDYDASTAETLILFENQDGAAADSTGILIRDTVSCSITANQMTGGSLLNNNTTLDGSTLSIFTDLFNSPQFEELLTTANLVSSYTPKGSGALDVSAHQPVVGVYPPSGRTEFLNYSTRVTDFPFEESGYDPTFDTLTGQSISTVVSDKRQVSTVSATGSQVQISGGNSPTYKIYDTNGTTVIESAIAVGESRIVYSSQYIEISDTTSPLKGVTYTVVLTAGSQTGEFQYTTSLGLLRTSSAASALLIA